MGIQAFRIMMAKLEGENAALRAALAALRKAVAGKPGLENLSPGQYLEMAQTLHAACDGGRTRAEAAEAEVARLKEALRPQWFYPLNETSSDDYRDSEGEIIDDALDSQRAGPGLHVVGMSYATALPDKYHVVKVYSYEEKDERDSDDHWGIIASFDTDEEARSLTAAKGG